MILVTGGTGLIGAHLLYSLSLDNKTVRATKRKNSNLEAVKLVFSYYSADFEDLFSKIEWVEADLEDLCALELAFENVTTVYHSAALISFDPKDFKKLQKINIQGTANIVNFCIDKQVKKLCYVSSVASIGKNINGALNTEENEWNSETGNYGYAITKYGAELEVWRASQEGVPVVIVNPGVVFGPGFWQQGSGQMFSKVKNGLKIYSEGITGFVGVWDVVRAMILLMKSDIDNERYILVAENLSYREVFTQIANQLGKRPPSVKVTPFLAGIAWRLDKIKSFITGKAPVLTRHAAQNIQKKNLFSSEKIIQHLDFKFEPIADVITTTCAHFSITKSVKRKTE